MTNEELVRLRSLINNANDVTLRALIWEIYEPRSQELQDLKVRVAELEDAIKNRQVQLKIVVENDT